MARANVASGDVPLSLSTALTLAVYGPALAYAWSTILPPPLLAVGVIVCVLPSPQSIRYVKPVAVSTAPTSAAVRLNESGCPRTPTAGPVMPDDDGSTLFTVTLNV